MQSVCKVRSRLEGFLGPFFLATAGILATGLQRPRRHRTARDSSASTAAQGSPDSGNKGSFGNSFGNRFGNRIFLEPLCFSIDSSISSLLLPMLLKNP